MSHLYSAVHRVYTLAPGGTGRLKESFLAIRGIDSHCGTSAPDAPALSRCHLAVRQADRPAAVEWNSTLQELDV